MACFMQAMSEDPRPKWLWLAASENLHSIFKLAEIRGSYLPTSLMPVCQANMTSGMV